MQWVRLKKPQTINLMYCCPSTGSISFVKATDIFQLPLVMIVFIFHDPGKDEANKLLPSIVHWVVVLLRNVIRDKDNEKKQIFKKFKLKLWLLNEAILGHHCSLECDLK